MKVDKEPAAVGGGSERADKAADLISSIKRAKDDFYNVLDVPRDADENAIKKAYRKAALQLHPDKCQLEGAKDAFQKVSEAFACLGDAEQRAHYDRTGRVRGAGNSVGHAYASHDADADAIFRAFFGDAFPAEAFAGGGARGGSGVHMRTFHMGGSSGTTYVYSSSGFGTDFDYYYGL
jgi:DnaJ family protein B protein 12